MILQIRRKYLDSNLRMKWKFGNAWRGQSLQKKICRDGRIFWALAKVAKNRNSTRNLRAKKSETEPGNQSRPEIRRGEIPCSRDERMIYERSQRLKMPHRDGQKRKEIHKYQTSAIAGTESGIPDDAKNSKCLVERPGMIPGVKGVFLADCLGIFIAYLRSWRLRWRGISFFKIRSGGSFMADSFHSLSLFLL